MTLTLLRGSGDEQILLLSCATGNFSLNMHDADLIREFVQDGSDTAFAELVQRHVDLVFSAARRQLGDAHLAEEVTQSVFCLLGC
jgi:hypothetical protein